MILLGRPQGPVRLEFDPAAWLLGLCWSVGGPVLSYRAGSAEYREFRTVTPWIYLLPTLAVRCSWEWRSR